jgi:hypothetical protein
MDARLRAFAEDAYAYTPAKPWQTVLGRDEFVLKNAATAGPAGGIAARLRMGSEFDRCVAEVKRWFAENGRAAFVWMLGPSSTPADARERLLAQGASILAGFETSACMVLQEKPAAGTSSLDVRKLETLAEYEERTEISAAAFGWGESYRESTKRLLREHWAELDNDRTESFGAFRRGRMVAFGVCAYTEHAVFLDGGATLLDARGAGAYRALVRARWDEAVSRGTPVLVAHAGPMSRPILERLGFRTVCELDVLTDNTRLAVQPD